MGCCNFCCVSQKTGSIKKNVIKKEYILVRFNTIQLNKLGYVGRALKFLLFHVDGRTDVRMSGHTRRAQLPLLINALRKRL
jgi:hypothetical protein